MSTSTRRKETVDAETIHLLLAKRYARPAWALLREVANATGGRAKRSADALAISLWPSRGIAIHGVEIKVSRSDWLRELKQPEKSAPIQRYCDHWWVAAPSTEVVRLDELPPTWGLLVVQGRNGLVAERQAPLLQPEQLTKDFVAALGRRMNEGVDAAKKFARAELVSDEDYQRGYECGKGDAAPELGRIERALETTQKTITDFEAASGVKIGYWNGGDVGQAVATVMKHQGLLGRDIIASHVGQLERALKAAKETQAALLSLTRRTADDEPASAHKYDVKMVSALLRDGVITPGDLRAALDEVEKTLASATEPPVGTYNYGLHPGQAPQGFGFVDDAESSQARSVIAK